MKYYAETQSLLSSFPKRWFEKEYFVNCFSRKGVNDKHKKTVRVGVWRVLKAMQEEGCVRVKIKDEKGEETKGKTFLYQWTGKA